MTKSIDKGKNYERYIADKLTDWAGFKIIRTPQSGAWQGTSGDIIPENRERPFIWIIECKKAERWSLEAILLGNCALFSSWLAQMLEEVHSDYVITNTWRLPVLIFSRNRKPDFVCIPVHYVSLLAYGICAPTFIKLNHSSDASYTIVPLDELLTFNSFESFEAFIERYLATSSCQEYFESYKSK